MCKESMAIMNVQRINGYDDFRSAQPNLIKCPNSIAFYILLVFVWFATFRGDYRRISP